MGSVTDFQAATVGFVVAFLLVVLLTPVVSLAAWRAGVLDIPSDERRLARAPMPRLGGLAIFAGIAIPALALGHGGGFWGVMLGAFLMCVLGAVDDVVSLHPGVKMVGLVAIAAVPVAAGVRIDHVTLPLLEPFNLGMWSAVLTIVWIVAIANIVNFIDGMDGLAAGFCAIAAITFAILSGSLDHP
jgi:UDP-GlcNAc:undecaprenyl-phosphate/decaprenyl-phosphate GlcNAc-1-phosphate transferase